MVNILKNHWFLTSATLLTIVLSSVLQTSQGSDLAELPTASACNQFLRPYFAHYDVYRNGKLLGTSTSVLSREQDGKWFYRVSTEATKGLGGLLGGEINESARFTVEAGVLKSEHYDLEQKVAFSKTRRSVDFDWVAKRASGKNQKKDWQMALQGDETDRLSANIRIRQQLAAGETQLSFRTIEKGELKIRDFEVHAAEMVATEMGEMLAIPVHRKHSNAKRTTVTWHAPQLGYLPVRVEHAKKGDDSGKLILTGFEQPACDTPATDRVAD